MKISFTDKISEVDHPVFIISEKTKKMVSTLPSVNKEMMSILQEFIKNDKNSSSTLKTLSYRQNSKIFYFTVSKLKNKIDKSSKLEYSGKILSYLESQKISNVSIFFIEDKEFKSSDHLDDIICGLFLKDYRFEKYKTISKKDFKITNLKLATKIGSTQKRDLEKKIHSLKGIFLTRDLVSEPANVLYPSKFVDYCSKLKKEGMKIEVFDEKKLKALGMNALLGVAQGSVRPARVMIFKWYGDKTSKAPPLAFVGKGVTFDTGGISIKPSSGMEDMKWDMGGAGVVAGLMYTLALRKAKVNVIGAVGLVENMPDGNAQRPGDIVKSMSGQTIEVLNTDAEGRLVLADVLWYIKEKFKPKLMVDLATLTGAIIVALGERYGGLFSNDDELAEKLFAASKKTKELLWRLPLDENFDKLLDCSVADMKNITGTRGAGSITAAQFLKRFVGNTSWAHLDIAGVTWSKKGTGFSRPGGTGFGVRLLDEFIKNYYEK
ncbi:MAG: leucyl aminopeptidase [Alphaproteobacteria bacterium]|nr:leucyl aminopeptidase [Alphaproteobacteria bacterium]